MRDVSPAVADLRSRWRFLHDLDRARAVCTIHNAGMSLRKLAKELNCSRSLLSRLLLAASAPPDDLALARQVPISTRALARRARPGGIGGTSRHPEAIAFDLECAAVQGSHAILSWLDEAGIAAPDRVQVVDHVRMHLINDGHLAQEDNEAALASALLDSISSLPRSVRIEPDRKQSLAESALRLALWILPMIPEIRVRDRALELARCDLPIRGAEPI